MSLLFCLLKIISLLFRLEVTEITETLVTSTIADLVATIPVAELVKPRNQVDQAAKMALVQEAVSQEDGEVPGVLVGLEEIRERRML